MVDQFIKWFKCFPLPDHFVENLQWQPLMISKAYCITAVTRIVGLICTHQKSLATLQPVEQRGTNIFWNGHNIANTACIHFKFGTVNNRYMLNSKPMKLGKKHNAQICYVIHYIMWTFWSLLVFKLYTIFDSKCNWNPQNWYLNVCINQQILEIVLEFTCALIYI